MFYSKLVNFREPVEVNRLILLLPTSDSACEIIIEHVYNLFKKMEIDLVVLLPNYFKMLFLQYMLGIKILEMLIP